MKHGNRNAPKAKPTIVIVAGAWHTPIYIAPLQQHPHRNPIPLPLSPYLPLEMPIEVSLTMSQ